MEHDQLVWFFRLSGPESLVNDQVETFNTFVRSVRFDDQKDPPITWTEPKTWTKDPPADPPDPLRYAGFRIDTKSKQLEVTVTRTPAGAYSLMPNMHRWQKQINRPIAETTADLDPYVKKEMVGDQKITWVDMQGLGVHSVSKPPPPPDAGRKNILPGFGMNRPPAAEAPFKYVAPEGWVKKGPRQFVIDSYEVRGGGGTVAEVTLSSLGGDAGGLALNINRWREQVKLPKIPADQVERSAKAIVVAGIDAAYFDIANPKGPAEKNHILGVIVPHAETTWFVKMTGPLDWVSQNQNAFETFVKSFKLDAR